MKNYFAKWNASVTEIISTYQDKIFKYTDEMVYGTDYI